MQSTMSHRFGPSPSPLASCLLPLVCEVQHHQQVSILLPLYSTIPRTSLQIRLFLAQQMVPLKLREVTNKLLNQFNTGSTASDTSRIRSVASGCIVISTYYRHQEKGLVLLPLRDRKNRLIRTATPRQTPQMCVQCRRKADVALASLGSAITPSPSWQGRRRQR